ncbi:MAG: cytidylate kinase-like family protein [Bacteroidales bacterium]|nr:cytidylate kinase-like family protein [Bacteroidales bacterium]
MRNKNYAIVIGRQFGCGGREIGKMVAEKLGIAYYDSELLIETAKQSGVAKEFFEAKDEKSPSFFSGMISLTLGFNSGTYLMSNAPINEDSIYHAQSEVITQIADRSSCVIVGRTADYILRNHCKVISIFLHSSMTDRVKRIMERGDCANKKEAKALAEKTNKMRASYYNFYTDKKWGEAETYDLSINAGILGDEATANLIVDYVKKATSK